MFILLHYLLILLPGINILLAVHHLVRMCMSPNVSHRTFYHEHFSCIPVKSCPRQQNEQLKMQKLALTRWMSVRITRDVLYIS